MVEGDAQVEWVLLDPNSLGVPWCVDQRTPLSETGLATVLREQQPFLRFDTHLHGALPEDPTFQRLGLRSFVALPLASKGRVIGVLLLASSQAGTYRASDLVGLPANRQLHRAIH